MPPRPKKQSAPDLARQLHVAEPDLAHAEIARRVSAQLRRPVTPWQVTSALRSSGKPGPRTHRTRGVEVRVTLEAAIAARARAYAEQSGYSLSEWVEGCLIAGVEDADQQAAARAAVERLRGTGAE